MKTQQSYRSNIEFIDKDYVASMFMANCELNNVYDEAKYRGFVTQIVREQSVQIQATLDTQKEIERRLNDVSIWYDKEKSHINTHALKRQRDEKIKHIYDNVDNILQNYTNFYQKNEALNDWKYIGSKKVFDTSLKYHSTWTYNDILAYFKQHGFPKKRKSVIEELESNLNVYKIRHILRNELMIDEAILLAFLEMQQRKDKLEDISDRKKSFAIFMIIVSVVLIIATANPGTSIIAWASLITSVASTGLSIYMFASQAMNEEAIKEMTNKTNELMLKNMPRPSNFVDTAITDPYSMYANGRLWKEGGAGRERYDQQIGYMPYKALIDDNFKDSNIYDVLNNNAHKLAGGEQYLSSLYPDAKWTNPSSLKAILNGAIPIYMNMRNKITQLAFRWLARNGLATYYLYEKNPDESVFKANDEYWSRYHAIEYENENDVKGFTCIIPVYKTGNIYVGYIHDVSTQWEKEHGEKTSKHSHNITEHAHIIYEREEKSVMQGKDIHIYNLQDIAEEYSGDEDMYNTFLRELSSIDWAMRKDGISDRLKQSWRIVEANKYYQCIYDIYNYGGVEVKYYKSVREIKDYVDGKTEFNLDREIIVSRIRIYTYKCDKFLVRGEAKAKIRFRSNRVPVVYGESDFIAEELETEQKPYISDGVVSRYFDRKTAFAYTGHTMMAVASDAQKDFVEVTIYHDENNDVTYFGMNAFLNPNRTVTMF